MQKIDLDFANSLKLILLEEKSVQLVLVGCGGTGSWLAPAIARVGKILIDRFQKAVEIAFYDPDQVEEKNIYRQNFCSAEIGKNKAEALAERYGLAWGIEINAVEKAFTSDSMRHHSGLRVIIGCVDRVSARKAINDSPADVWLDCGNTRSYGQVLCGVGPRQRVKAFAIPGYCGMLPPPGLVHPELLTGGEDSPTSELGIASSQAPRNDNNISCAEIALLDSQGLAINQRMAAEAADYLVRMLITKDLRKYATYIDLESGTAQSKYITEKAIKHYAKL